MITSVKKMKVGKVIKGARAGLARWFSGQKLLPY